MPEYRSKCTNCQHEIDYIQSIKAKPKVKCPKCKKNKLERVIFASHGHVKKSAYEMSTVGDLACYNTDKLSTWEKESKDEKLKAGSRLMKHKIEKPNLPKPWWHDTKHPMDKLATATDKEKKDYIENGATPSDKKEEVRSGNPARK